MRTLQRLCIVVPCYNEQEVLEQSHQHLLKVLEDLKIQKKIVEYEILYVNDGSKDRTKDILEDIFHNNSCVRVIEFRRNFGFQSALTAGLEYAQADAVVTIDCDLQDPPEKISEMVDYYSQGYDLVLGVREDRTSDTWFKRFTAETYYRTLAFLGVEVVYNHADFRLMAKSLVDEFNALPERNRFMRALILQLDNHYATVSYARQKRLAGVSKFNLLRMLSLSFDGIFAFTIKPLRIATFLGFLMCLLALAGSVWAVYLKFTQQVIHGWFSMILPVMLIGGVQLVVLGMMGEYIGRLYTEVKARPLFSVRRELKK